MKRLATLSLAALSLASCNRPRTGVLETSAVQGSFDPLEPCLRCGRVVWGQKDTLRRNDDCMLRGHQLGSLTLANDSIDDYDRLLICADVLHDGQPVAHIDNAYDGQRQLTEQTLMRPRQRVSNIFTWSDETANLMEVKQLVSDLDEAGAVVAERQEVLTLSYEPKSAFSNWSSGLARYLVGEKLESLFYSGLLGRTSWWLPVSLEYTWVETDGRMVKAQHQEHGEVTYLKDCHGLVVEEHYFDPHQTVNDYVYTYDVQIGY